MYLIVTVLIVTSSLYKIICNPMHPLNGALPGPYVPVRVTPSALAAHKCIYTPPHCKASQYRRTFNPLSVFLLDDLADPVFNGVGLTGFNSQAFSFFISLSCSIPTIVFCYFSFSLLSVYRLVLCGWGFRTNDLYHSLPALHCRPILIIIKIIMTEIVCVKSLLLVTVLLLLSYLSLSVRSSQHLCVKANS